MAKKASKSKAPGKVWVRFKQCRTGELDGVSYLDQVGDERELETEEALRCQAAGQVVLIPAPSRKEQTVAP